jgi:enoyl-[acyl-carrier protein] reductase I
MAKRARPLMQVRGGGSIVTMTYMASERVMPKYNVMAVAKAALECNVRYLAYELGEYNIRVNAISAGPLNTLAARGVSGFTAFREQTAHVAPLQRNINQSEVGDAALFLCSPLARAVTGEILFVDAGYNIMGA